MGCSEAWRTIQQFQLRSQSPTLEGRSALDRLSKHPFGLGLYDRNEPPEDTADE